MGLTYNAIIPVVNRDLAAMLLKSIRANTIFPDSIIIIDNSMTQKAFPLDDRLSVTVIDPKKRLDVNASWNLGIREAGKCDYVAILNDDVILGSKFFERNIRVFEEYPDCGITCPGTTNNPGVALDGDAPARIVRMKKREGWAMSFRWPLLREIPPIPDDLKTFCGDDWFWIHTHMKGFRWYGDAGNIVYHKVGTAVRELGVRSHLRQDKETLQKLVIK